MEYVTVHLYGGRIESMKYALRLAIEQFEKSHQHDMTLIYRDMLEEIERRELKVKKESK
jgi:hypothetical protein